MTGTDRVEVVRAQGRFAALEDLPDEFEREVVSAGRIVGGGEVAAGGQSVELPGPTGESNRLTSVARGAVLCLGPGEAAAGLQAAALRALGGQAVVACSLEASALERLDIAGAIWWGDAETGRAYARALAQRKGPILPLIGGMPDAAHAMLERHVCIDTTASGGNAQLLVAVSEV